MGFYQLLKQTFQSQEHRTLEKEYLIKARRQPSIVRIEKPLKLYRARALGYKAKQGVIVVRVRVKRGGRKRPTIRAGRRPKHFHQEKVLGKNYQWIAEERAARKYPNCEVVNSYLAFKDGKHYWFEVILVDREHPAIIKDKQLKNIAKQHGRVFRGLTSAGRKSRGLRNKGLGAEKVRPSQRANKRKAK